jgi:hypothetical protein
MRRPFTTDERRRGGRKRAQTMTKDERRRGGQTRAAQVSHRDHNRAIASSGYWAWSTITMRGSTGLKLAMTWQIHFLRPERLKGPDGECLSSREQRLLFGIYVWKATWEGLPWPPPPTDEQYLAEVARVQAVVGRGLPLAHPMDALYVAPNDFCDEHGQAWGKTRQRKLFRDALRAARAYAEDMEPLLREVYGDHLWLCQPPEATMLSRFADALRVWKPGARRPMRERRPQFPGQVRPIVKRRFGRPDLPHYDRENLLPSRPYAVAQSSDSYPCWAACAAPLTDDFYEY